MYLIAIETLWTNVWFAGTEISRSSTSRWVQLPNTVWRWYIRQIARRRFHLATPRIKFIFENSLKVVPYSSIRHMTFILVVYVKCSVHRPLDAPFSHMCFSLLSLSWWYPPPPLSSENGLFNPAYLDFFTPPPTNSRPMCSICFIYMYK